MAWTHLITTEELAQHLESGNFVVVDCRFDLFKLAWGQADYRSGHIPGAVYADLNQDLSGPATATTGRHPLPAPGEFIQTASRLGIDHTKQVVCYDTTGGSFAVRLWWLLRFFGHKTVAVLDGGWKKWLAESRPVEIGSVTNHPAIFDGAPRPDMLADSREVEKIRLDPNHLLIDARTPERYRGEVEPIDPEAGHIPGAVNRFHGDNLGPDGALKRPDELRQEFDRLLAGVAPANVVVYCGSGVTSIHHLLAMEMAGLNGAKLYVGSWSEWLRDPNRPRATKDTLKGVPPHAL